MDGVEVGEAVALGGGEFFGIDQAFEQGGEAAEEHAENHADEDHARQIAPALAQQGVEQQQRAAHHRRQFEGEFAGGRHHTVARAAEQDDEQGLQKDVERVEAEDGGGEDGVVGEGLEQQGGHAHGVGGQQQPGQGRAASAQDEIPAALHVEGEEQGAAGQQKGKGDPQRLVAREDVFRRHGRASSSTDRETAPCRARRTRWTRGFQTGSARCG